MAETIVPQPGKQLNTPELDVFAENERLRGEVAILEEIAEGVATANESALEMMFEVERAQAEVGATNEKLRAIIDNVQFGFFIIDKELRVSEEVTHSCLALFGQNKVANRHLDEVLGLDEYASEILRMSIDQVFEDILPENVTCDQLPCRFQVDNRIISMKARVLRSESENVHSILFSVIDVTDLEQERRQNIDNKTLLCILHDRGAFLNFIAEARSNVQLARAGLAEKDQSLVRRLVHTIKGNSSIFGLMDVVGVAHRVEEDNEIGVEGIAAIEEAVRVFLQDNYPILAVEWERESEPTFEVSTTSLTSLDALLATGDVDAAREWIRKLRMIRADTVWGPLPSLVEQLSMRYEKQVRLEVEGGDTRLRDDSMIPLLTCLQHIIRNAVIHGIEFPLEREEQGKDGCGTIRLSLQSDRDSFTIEITDDGRGINGEAVAEKYIEKGIRSAEEVNAMSDAEKRALILCDGVTTVEVADVNAGRGEGLAALKAAVGVANGSIYIDSTLGKGTVFRMTVPNVHP